MIIGNRELTHEAVKFHIFVDIILNTTMRGMKTVGLVHDRTFFSLLARCMFCLKVNFEIVWEGYTCSQFLRKVNQILFKSA